MKLQDRWYQTECAETLFKRVQLGKRVHPLAAIPTAAGKTIILCRFVDLYLSKNPRAKILVLSHVQEIIEQDYDALHESFEYDEESQEFTAFTNITIFSSGLGIKQVKKITVASIQSTFRKPERFEEYDVVIIDEAHLIGLEETGMYRKFLSKIPANYVGLTATPFRTGHGYIHEGKDALFNDLCYDLTSYENFNRLTDEGFLARIISKRTKLTLNVDGVRMLGGDFSQKGLSKNINRIEITKRAVEETIAFGKDYKRWLLFAIDIEHAENIAKMLIENGISTLVVHSKMEGDRKQLLKDAKAGIYRAVVSVGVLTTGYNDPHIDLIAVLRPTVSPIFHVQSAGRGLRPVFQDGFDLSTIEGRLQAQATGPKPHCLVLDFAGNAKRLGPINDVHIKQKDEDKEGSGGPMVKYCENCEAQNHLSAKFCYNCGEEFPRSEKLQANADEDYEIVRGEKTDSKPKSLVNWHDVESINFQIKQGDPLKPKFLLVTYTCGDGKKIKEQVNLDHTGQARYFAKFWITQHMRKDITIPFPETVDELYESLKFMQFPNRVLVDESKKYPHFVERLFPAD